MNIVLQTSERALVSLSAEEHAAIANALNEVCNGIDIPDSEFQTRLGVTRKVLKDLLESLSSKTDPDSTSYEAVDVWADQNSVMVRSITVFGDPVEMSTTEASGLSGRLAKAADEAS